MKSNSEVASFEDFKDISKVILQENQKSIQKMQKEFNKVVVDKEEKISRLRYQSQKLLFKSRRQRIKHSAIKI